jgi:hypothetical protein
MGQLAGFAGGVPRAVVGQLLDRHRQSVHQSEALFYALDHQIADVAGVDAAGRRYPGDHLAVQQSSVKTMRTHSPCDRPEMRCCSDGFEIGWDSSRRRRRISACTRRWPWSAAR